MAIYVPLRPRWNPRGEVVNYVSRGRLVARGWPKGYHDANTLGQRQQRGKMVQVCRALPYLKALLAEGYSAVVKRNGRCVSGYHAAVGVALREWFARTPRGWQLDLARVRLTDGVRGLPEGLTATRISRGLRVAWEVPLPWDGSKVLVAVRQKHLDQWVSVVHHLSVSTVRVDLQLPTAWQGREVEVWVAFVGRGGRVKTSTLHAVVSAAVSSGGGQSVGRHGVERVVCPSLARRGERVRSAARCTRSRGACKFGLPRLRCVSG